MESIFNYDDYKLWIRTWVNLRPNRGRGELTRLADAAQMFPSSVSQILNGHKHLTLEQAIEFADHMALSITEREYFLLLVQRERAGTPRLRSEYESLIKRIKRERLQASARPSAKRAMSAEEGTIFYSSWLYAATQALCSIDSCQSTEELAKRMHITVEQMRSILEYMLRAGICIEERNRIKPGSKQTLIENSSPMISRHHSNWRLKAMEKHVKHLTDSEISVSSPMAVSYADSARVREMLVRASEQIQLIQASSRSEVAFFLNIDWLGF